jgi:polysaccharide pyruvyl transferase WcaK-like protein
MKLIIFNVKYSPNLGDGLLSECLEKELLRQPGGVSVVSLDLAGRQAYGEGGGRSRKISLQVLHSLPIFLRLFLAGSVLRRKVARLRPGWRRRLGVAEAVVLGGGNLLADADLNFPVKIGGALAEAAGKPLAVFGIGVTDNWSTPGERLFRRAFVNARICHVAVRDDRSKEIWDRKVARGTTELARVCRDPGLLASMHFSRAKAERFTVGFCLTSPVALRYHASPGQQFDDIDDWISDVLRKLTSLGWPVTLFTNGSPEDIDYLYAIGSRLRSVSPLISIEEPFGEPSHLTSLVSSLGLLFAHRMHACIAAYSYGVPHIGLTWDKKVDSFFKSVDRQDYMVDPARTSPSEAVALAERAVAVGIAEGARQRVLREASQDIALMCRALQDAVKGAGSL